MKKSFSFLMMGILVLSMILGMFTPAFAMEGYYEGEDVFKDEQMDIWVTKLNGSLSATGNSETYLIRNFSGGKIENFTSKYTFSHNTKLPLSVSGPTSIDIGDTFQVKVLDTCQEGSIYLTGTVTISKIGTKLSADVINIHGQEITNSVVNVTGEISITSGSGSRLYNFTSSTGTTNIYFGEDATVKVAGAETGNKCLAYNIDPNQNIKSKYSLTSKNSAFINFVGGPEFDNTVTVQLAVPISSAQPHLYKLKDGSTSELVKITDAKVSSTNAGEVITFTTTNLSETYVITDQELNVEAAAPEKTPETPVDKEPTKPAEKPENTKPPVDDTEDSPQTGGTAFISTVFAVMAASALAFVLVLKKKH